MSQKQTATQPVADKQPKRVVTEEMRAASLKVRQDKALRRKDERIAQQEGRLLEKRRSAAEINQAEALLRAERMAPRPCKFQTCQTMFVPKRPQDWKSEFCCKEHQQQFWIEANRLSAAVLKGGDLPLSIKSEYRPGISHTTQVLAILEGAKGDGWVSLRKLLPEVNPNVISKLRQAGFDIEMREVGERPFTVSHDYRRNWRRFQPGGSVEYQYRLVKS